MRRKVTVTSTEQHDFFASHKPRALLFLCVACSTHLIEATPWEYSQFHGHIHNTSTDRQQRFQPLISNFVMVCLLGTCLEYSPRSMMTVAGQICPWWRQLYFPRTSSKCCLLIDLVPRDIFTVCRQKFSSSVATLFFLKCCSLPSTFSFETRHEHLLVSMQEPMKGVVFWRPTLKVCDSWSVRWLLYRFGVLQYCSRCTNQFGRKTNHNSLERMDVLDGGEHAPEIFVS